VLCLYVRYLSYVTVENKDILQYGYMMKIAEFCVDIFSMLLPKISYRGFDDVFTRWIMMVLRNINVLYYY